MPRLTVHSSAQTSASPNQAWAVVRDFCAPWHPAVESMTRERTENGDMIRRFSVTGEDTVYRERLTYFSDSERMMAYTHVAGIVGIDRYDAHLTVTPAPAGATVTMSAEISAPSARVQDIADGTKAIFDAGTQAVATLALSQGITAPAPPAKSMVNLDTVRIDGDPRLALTTGGAQGDTLCLFLHGIGGNRSNWKPQLAALAPHIRVAALDLRGYGGSARGPAQSTIEDYCDDIERVRDFAGAQKLILCGLSYGAWIATSYAMRHPARLAALVLSGGCTGMSEAAADERAAFRRSRETPLNAGQTPADFAPAIVDIIAGPDASTRDRDALLASMQAIPAATYADALRCFTNPPETFDFAKLALPVLLMTGEHDRLAPPAEIKDVAGRIRNASPRPDVRYERIAGAGHVCNLEKPDACNAILADFVRRVLP